MRGKKPQALVDVVAWRGGDDLEDVDATEIRGPQRFQDGGEVHRAKADLVVPPRRARRVGKMRLAKPRPDATERVELILTDELRARHVVRDEQTRMTPEAVQERDQAVHCADG